MRAGRAHQKSLRRRSRHRRLSGSVVAAVCAFVFGALSSASPQAVAASSSGSWYKADLHVHSVISADAFPDLGILTQAAKNAGYNAIFLTDHNLGSNFPISGLTANYMLLDEPTGTFFRRWTPATYGSLSSSTDAVVTSPVFSGTHSLLLSSTSSSGGQTFVWTKRGPNFRSETGPINLQFSIYPVQLDAASSLFVSATIGGDPTVKDPSSNPLGYTTSSGVISPHKSTILTWYYGSAPPSTWAPSGPAYYPYSLSSGAGGSSCNKAFALNTWITCTIDVRAALGTLASGDVSLDHDGLSDLKIGTAAISGTAKANFDAYTIQAPSAKAAGASLAADEFVYRNTLLPAYQGTNSLGGPFSVFPSLEMGINEHAQRFNFGITQPSEFVSYSNGIDGILPTQQSGYPAQLNHPGVPGGVTDSEAINTNANDADLMEVRMPNMINDWDSILSKGVQVIGTWGSDNHIASWSAGSEATYIYAPSDDFNSLTRSMYEGRLFLGFPQFAGKPLIFNLDGSANPYPARYPVFVSASALQATAELQINGGFSTGSNLVWITKNGTIVATGAATAGSETRSVSLSGTTTYLRAEIRRSDGTRIAMTQPVFFTKVNGLPAGMSFHVDGVTTPDAAGYTILSTKGITASSWDSTNSRLSLTLTDPAGSLAELEAATAGHAPSSVSVDGILVAAVASRADFDAASSSSWYYDSGASELHVKAGQQTSSTSVTVSFEAISTDTTSPTVPAGVAATAVSSSQINVAWSASTDPDGPVAGYTIYRNGTAVGTVGGAATSFSDTALAASTTYSYAVDGFDAAGNRSAQSISVSATTYSGTPPPPGGVFGDGFESGSFGAWSSETGLAIETSIVQSGTYAAEGNTSNGSTYARKTLISTYSSLYERTYFYVKSASTAVNLLYARTATGSSIAHLSVSPSNLVLRNDVTGISVTGPAITANTWHSIELQLNINGTSSTTQVWMDGNPVSVLSTTTNLGMTPIGMIQIGDNLTGHIYDLCFDDVAADTSFIS